MKRKLIVIVLILVGIAGAGAFYRARTAAEAPTFLTVAVTRGSIIDAVEATGTLEPVDPVQIGSQVTGTVVSLGTDFNQQVKKGQIVATLDPAVFQAQVEQAQASVDRLEADLQRARVQVADAKQKLARSQALAKENLIPAQDLDAASILLEANEAALKSAEAQLAQSRAQLEQSKVNLGHTIIRAPSDGIVLSRSVETGQTVSASLQAPTLFIVARDLSRMRVNASVDESDIGRVKAGQTVHFMVDAYGQETFTGTVSEVRLQPVVTSGVVSYPTVIDVPNPSLRLKPGMTATVSIELARQDEVLRIPVSALRFRPTAEQRGWSPDAAGDASTRPGGDAAAGERRRGSGGAGSAAGGNAAVGTPPGGDASGGRGRFARANAGPGGNDASAGGRGGRAMGDRPGAGRDGSSGEPQTRVVWQLVNNKLTPVRVRIGLANATHAALIDGPLDAGAQVVTGVAQQNASAAPTGTNSPLMPNMPRRGPGGGGPGGGGPGGGQRR
jgi:HlyD family secretion protein